ncbi:DUF2177 family protein [Amylibacter sp. IMCC11727]|uniref:DUF2177 family protein n=1 Tax=Amylibacter sp. IMCC11727 TaxID=3039851 RepID=UPI003262EA7B
MFLAAVFRKFRPNLNAASAPVSPADFFEIRNRLAFAHTQATLHLMQTLTLYAITAVIFLALDAIMLTRVMSPLFERHIGAFLLPDLRLGAAVAFYLAYIVGVLYFASLPALAEGAPIKAFLNGAILGAMAYGTYEFTNLATLKGWSWQMVAVDVTWGAVLSGVSAWAGVTLTRMIFS